MAGKDKKGKKGKDKGDSSSWSDTVAVILKRDCAEALYAALVIALGTLPTPKKKKKSREEAAPHDSIRVPYPVEARRPRRMTPAEWEAVEVNRTGLSCLSRQEARRSAAGKTPMAATGIAHRCARNRNRSRLGPGPTDKAG